MYCGVRMSHCNWEWGKEPHKIYCKKCRKLYQKGEIPAGPKNKKGDVFGN